MVVLILVIINFQSLRIWILLIKLLSKSVEVKSLATLSAALEARSADLNPAECAILPLRQLTGCRVFLYARYLFIAFCLLLSME